MVYYNTNMVFIGSFVHSAIKFKSKSFESRIFTAISYTHVKRPIARP